MSERCSMARNLSGGDEVTLKTTLNADEITEGLDLRIKSIEDSLAPLIAQVTTLARRQKDKDLSDPNSRKGRRPVKLARAVDLAVQQFVVAGRQIAADNPSFRDRLSEACDGVSLAREEMRESSLLFVEDPRSTEKRVDLVQSSRKLLKAVAKLMIEADYIDIQNLLRASYRIEELLKALYHSADMKGVRQVWRVFAADVIGMMHLASQRQEEFKDDRVKEFMAVSRAEFDKFSKLFLTAAKTQFECPSSPSAKETKEFVLGQMQKALKTIATVADGESPSNLDPDSIIVVPPAEEGEIHRCFVDLQSSLSSSLGSAPSLKELDRMRRSLETVCRGVSFVAESARTRPAPRGAVLSSCKAVVDGLKDLTAVAANDQLRVAAIKKVEQNLSKLQYHLSRCMADHMSDTFLDTSCPVIELMETSERGDQRAMEEKTTNFLCSAREIEKVSSLACSLSSDAQGVKLARYTLQKTASLAPQVVSAAETLAMNPTSKPAQENMAAFKDLWEETVESLTDAVDIIMPVDVFMAVTVAHIKEDIAQCIKAASQDKMAAIDTHSGLVRGRCARLMKVVRSDLEENPDRYDETGKAKIFASFVKLREKALPKFSDETERAAGVLSASHDPNMIDFHALQHSGDKVLEVVASLRKRVLLTLPKEVLEHDPEALSLVATAAAKQSDQTSSSGSPVHTASQQPSNLSALPPPPPSLLPPPSSPPHSPSHLTQPPPSSITLVTRQVNTAAKPQIQPKSPPSTPSHSQSGSEDSVSQSAPLDGGNSNKRIVFERSPIPSDTLTRSAAAKVAHPPIMANLPEEEQKILAMDSEALQQQHSLLQTEASKWIEISSDNDVVTIAREMCAMMMDMSDFTRGQGPLKTGDDVIQTAKDIVRAGDQLVKLAKKVAEECPDANCKSDLLAYLDQVMLCCHQLRICGAVRADLRVRSVREKMERASGIMSAAKNLMNSVVLTVKMCYIASKSIAKVKGSAGTLLQWEMKTPRKKDLMGTNYADEFEPGDSSKSDSDKKAFNRYDSTIAPFKELGQFRGKGIQSTCL